MMFVEERALWVPRGEAPWRMGVGKAEPSLFLSFFLLLLLLLLLYAFQRERKVSAPSFVI